MSTRSSARNLFPPLDNPELTIRRRSHADPTLLNDFEMVAEGNGGPISPIAIQATNFRLKNDMIHQVQNSCQFHGLPGDDANKHLDKFLHVTQSIKVNGATDDALRGTFMKRRPKEYYDLIENMTAHHNDWDTSAQQTTVGQTQNVYAAGAYQGGNSYKPQGNCNLLSYRSDNYLGPPGFNQNQNQNNQNQNFHNQNRNQENHNPQGNNQRRNQFFQGASHGQKPPPAYQAPAYQAPGYQALVHQPQILQPQLVTTNEFTNFMKANDAILKNMQTNMTSLTNSNLELKNMIGQFMKMNTASSSGSGTLPGNIITNPNEDLKGVTTRSGTAYQGPMIPTTTSSSLPPVVERETEATKDTMHPTNNRSTKDVQPMVIQTKSPILNSEPIIAPIIEPVVAPVSAPKPNQRPSIPPGRSRRKYKSNAIISVEQALASGNYLPQLRKELKICEAKTDKSSIDEPLEVKLKDVPPHLEYTFLEGDDMFPVMITKDLSVEEKNALITVLKAHKRSIAWKLSDIKENEENELILTGLVMGWHVCIDYRKLNEATRKDHFPLPFMDQMLERLARNEYYCFFDDFSGYFQIPIDPKDQEKTTFTCPYRTFAYRRMPFGLYNASDTNLYLNLEKRHFMVKEGIILDHKISKDGIEVDKAKVDVIAKLPYPTTVKGIRSFLGHAGFYHRFIKDFSKIAWLMTRLLEKETSFLFFKECVEAFQTLKRKLTATPILIAPDWDLPFELMCDASYFSIAVDYLSKWVEAKAVPTNDARVVCKFLKNLFARFGNPCAIISDRGTYFCNDQFAKVILKYGVTHRLATAYHPQTSGQLEVSNCGLKQILERTVGENCASWSDKLDDALWAFRTTYKTSIGCTPYKLVYEKACHLPIELEHKAYWALKHANYDIQTAGDHKKVQLNELIELHDQAYENSLIYKEKTKRLHDSKIKDRVFNIGDRVLLFNSRLKIFLGKLNTRWSGPFTVSHVFPYGTIELSQPDGPNFKVNGHKLKHYFGEDIQKMVVPNL
uniref:Reverse transcriptase domain-containing protein n=1 Tax=Tanacetum cinerariifolium TaxID=118510 RepID=A0A6L2NA86_TANCI|nr:reverse transcriptase domain-containing protein [Tanacetum cinerariifolium]